MGYRSYASDKQISAVPSVQVGKSLGACQNDFSVKRWLIQVSWQLTGHRPLETPFRATKQAGRNNELQHQAFIASRIHPTPLMGPFAFRDRDLLSPPSDYRLEYRGIRTRTADNYWHSVYRQINDSVSDRGPKCRPLIHSVSPQLSPRPPLLPAPAPSTALPPPTRASAVSYRPPPLPLLPISLK